MKTIKELQKMRMELGEVKPMLIDIGYYNALKDVLKLIDERIDHWEPYRPLTESNEAIAIRKELRELQSKIIGEEEKE